MENTIQKCPICSVEVSSNVRYPNYVCGDCAKKATDENGRSLTFYNTHLSGGFEAIYTENNKPRDGNVCFINGIKCIASEARFGGIVIQPEESTKRS